jgi:hypothetical protein
MCKSDDFRDALAPLSDCRECFTPCQAYPTIMHHPIRALGGYARAALDRS